MIVQYLHIRQPWSQWEDAATYLYLCNCSWLLYCINTTDLAALNYTLGARSTTWKSRRNYLYSINSTRDMENVITESSKSTGNGTVGNPCARVCRRICEPWRKARKSLCCSIVSFGFRLKAWLRLSAQEAAKKRQCVLAFFLKGKKRRKLSQTTLL